MTDYQKVSGILLIAIVGLVAVTLELAKVIDIMANLTDVFFWIAAPVLGIAFGLLTRSLTKPKMNASQLEKDQRPKQSEKQLIVPYELRTGATSATISVSDRPLMPQVLATSE